MRFTEISSLTYASVFWLASSIATLSEDLVRKLLAWRHPGFSAHVGEAIASADKKAVEDVACYLVRAPLSLKKLVYLTALGLSPPEDEKPPPIREVLRVPVDDDGREIQAS